MKKTLIPLALLIGILCLSISSCTKEQVSDSNFVNAQTEDQSVSLVSLTDGTQKLTLRPGKDGQDTYVSKIDNDSNDGNGNQNYIKELAIGKWTYAYTGLPTTWRSFIKFDSLSKIPDTATIVSAKLYLCGESSSLTFPFGNSYYIGSSNPENSCLIQRVIGHNWDEKTLTFNNQPRVTTKDQVTIPPSTTQWDYDVVVDVTKLVKTMRNSGKNYGFCIRMVTEELYRSMVFGTSESDHSIRPKLVVEYK